MNDIATYLIVFMCATAAWVGLLLLPGAPTQEQKFNGSRRLKIAWTVAVLVFGFSQIGLAYQLFVIGRPIGVWFIFGVDVSIIFFFTVMSFFQYFRNKSKNTKLEVS